MANSTSTQSRRTRGGHQPAVGSARTGGAANPHLEA